MEVGWRGTRNSIVGWSNHLEYLISKIFFLLVFSFFRSSILYFLFFFCYRLSPCIHTIDSDRRFIIIMMKMMKMVMIVWFNIVSGKQWIRLCGYLQYFREKERVSLCFAREKENFSSHSFPFDVFSILRILMMINIDSQLVIGYHYWLHDNMIVFNLYELYYPSRFCQLISYILNLEKEFFFFPFSLLMIFHDGNKLNEDDNSSK